MSSEDYRQIIDFLFSGAEIPEDLEEEFQEWLSRHGDDERVLKILEGHWESFPADKNGFDLPAGLDDLHRRIGRDMLLSQRRRPYSSLSASCPHTFPGTSGRKPSLWLPTRISGSIPSRTELGFG